jgi:hypothetical protein
MRKLLLLLFFSGVFTCVVNAQKNSHSAASEKNKDWNLPPGFVLNAKTNTQIDYSFKIYEPIINEEDSAGRNFLRDFSEEDIADMKKNWAEAYRYYMAAEQFYKNLSTSIKSRFTIEELWYIYMFDQKLKNQLLTVK